MLRGAGDKARGIVAKRFAVSTRAVREFEPGGGVFHVDGPDWVVRVFPSERPRVAADHDALVLTALESAALPAERLASEEPVWTLDDGQAALTTHFVPGRQCRG